MDGWILTTCEWKAFSCFLRFKWIPKTHLASFAVQQLEGIAVVRLCENLDAVQLVNHAVAVDISVWMLLWWQFCPSWMSLAAPLQISAVSSDQIQVDTEDESQRFQQHCDYLQVMVV